MLTLFCLYVSLQHNPMDMPFGLDIKPSKWPSSVCLSNKMLSICYTMNIFWACIFFFFFFFLESMHIMIHKVLTLHAYPFPFSMVETSVVEVKLLLLISEDTSPSTLTLTVPLPDSVNLRLNFLEELKQKIASKQN